MNESFRASSLSLDMKDNKPEQESDVPVPLGSHQKATRNDYHTSQMFGFFSLTGDGEKTV